MAFHFADVTGTLEDAWLGAICFGVADRVRIGRCVGDAIIMGFTLLLRS
jgi:hypothetical protein